MVSDLMLCKCPQLASEDGEKENILILALKLPVGRKILFQLQDTRSLLPSSLEQFEHEWLYGEFHLQH